MPLHIDAEKRTVVSPTNPDSNRNALNTRVGSLTLKLVCVATHISQQIEESTRDAIVAEINRQMDFQSTVDGTLTSFDHIHTRGSPDAGDCPRATWFLTHGFLHGLGCGVALRPAVPALVGSPTTPKTVQRLFSNEHLLYTSYVFFAYHVIHDIPKNKRPYHKVNILSIQKNRHKPVFEYL